MALKVNHFLRVRERFRVEIERLKGKLRDLGKIRDESSPEDLESGMLQLSLETTLEPDDVRREVDRLSLHGSTTIKREEKDHDEMERA